MSRCIPIPACFLLDHVHKASMQRAVTALKDLKVRAELKDLRVRAGLKHLRVRAVAALKVLSEVLTKIPSLDLA